MYNEVNVKWDLLIGVEIHILNLMESMCGNIKLWRFLLWNQINN